MKGHVPALLREVALDREVAPHKLLQLKGDCEEPALKGRRHFAKNGTKIRAESRDELLFLEHSA